MTFGCGDDESSLRPWKTSGRNVESRCPDIYEKTVPALKPGTLDEVIHGNALHADLSPADVVTLTC